MVIAPANTGKDNKSKNAVIPTAQIKRGIWSKDKLFNRILIIVVIKLIAPKIDEIPAKWREKIAKSTELPLCAILDESGG